MRRKNTETWIQWRTAVNRGWLPTPRHARGGRHADTSTRRGRRVANAVSN